jgi:uncharacterized protein (TIGR00730 family)
MTDPGETLNQLIDDLVAATGAKANRDLVRDILLAGTNLGSGDASRLDLKMAKAALSEMGRAFSVFAPYHDVPKVTIFGSARTASTDGLYAQARDLAARMAEAGWMTVTGAGPGIMAAGTEGAGARMSIGVNIRLPFEQAPNQYLADDGHLVEMRYFFTRKLMLMKESAGFAALPGGFGTLDESFELITLLQTGKAEPAPIVFLERPGDTYWSAWTEFVSSQVIEKGYAGTDDAALWRVVESVDDAVTELLGFYRNYHSRRFVGSTMVLRLRLGVSDAELEELNRDFADVLLGDGLVRTEPLPPERAGSDHVELPRLRCLFDGRRQGRLRELIDALNRCDGPGEAAGN